MTQRLLDAEPPPLPSGEPPLPTGVDGRLGLKIAFCVLLPLALFYLIVTHSVPLGLSQGAPAAALFLHRDYPAAVSTLAERAITAKLAEPKNDARSKAKNEGDENAAALADIESALRGQIVRRPLDARAFRQLGQIADFEGKPEEALRFMEVAARLSAHEPAALATLMLQALGKGKFKTALYYADILLRSSVPSVDFVLPIVVRLMDYPPARQEIARMFSAAPPWRSLALQNLPRFGGADPNAPRELLRALRKTRYPPTQREIDAYLTYLLNRKLYALAYAVWLEFLTPDQTEDVAYLFNGSFEREPAGSPFDWTIGEGGDTTVKIFPREDKDKARALYVAFGEGRATLPPVKQTIVLPPGNYRFSGEFMGELKARRGLQWRVSCADGKVAGESEMILAIAPEWRKFSFDFAISRENCAAQTVELLHMARSPSEQLATGFMWFDDLAVIRILDNNPEAR